MAVKNKTTTKNIKKCLIEIQWKVEVQLKQQLNFLQCHNLDLDLDLLKLRYYHFKPTVVLLGFNYPV